MNVAVNKKDGLVSIGLPTFNRPQGLRRVIEELLSQTYSNIEIIISDNASTNPGVEETIKEFENKDARVRAFRQKKNVGPLKNFQFVLDKSQGEFFMWAADDDYRETTYIAVLLEQLHKCPECPIAFCDFNEVNVNRKKIESYPNHFPLLRPFTSNSKYMRLIYFIFQSENKGKANLIYGLMRRDILKSFQWERFVFKYGFYGADMLLMFSILCEGPLALTEQRLYQCTVGNLKDYGNSSGGSLWSKLATHVEGLTNQMAYTFQYVRIARGKSQVIMLICWPFKALDVLLRLILVAKLRNLYERIKRYFARYFKRELKNIDK